MPPKAKKASEPSKKTEQKKKDKIIEDKTFGLKNKKGAKQQKFIKHVNHQVTYGNASARKLEELQKEKESKKDAKKREQDELNALFRPVEQKVTKGADPKSMLCMFFKQGLCQKGDKCKFSHDLNVGRKGEKRSIYADEESAETMDDWDEQKLEEVVNQKHGESNKKKNQTTIICKYFLDAVENSKYGWFWNCPNGQKDCKYVHALPPGFQLKKDKKKEDSGEKISLEDLIERERAALSSKNLTKVTLESFLKWKDKKKKEKIAARKKESDKKKADYKAGRSIGISGREMFEFNPELVAGDDEEADGETYKRESDEEEEAEEDQGPVREVNLDMFAEELQVGAEIAPPSSGEQAKQNGPSDAKNISSQDAEASKLDMAAGGNDPPTDSTAAAIAAAEAATVADDIDEDLFDGDDLDLVEEELETLELDA